MPGLFFSDDFTSRFTLFYNKLKLKRDVVIIKFQVSKEKMATGQITKKRTH